MPTYNVEAFRWSGTGYNATYTTSYAAAITDNDPNYEGGGDGDETVSINGGAAAATSSLPYAIDVSFTDVNGDPHVETFYFFNTTAAPGGWFFVPAPGSAFTVGATLGSYQSHTTGWSYSSIVCFASGTLIATPQGERRVDALRPGDEVCLAGGGVATLRANMCSRVSTAQLLATESLFPVRITAGALGQGLPKRDLLVSRQHRMFMSSPVAQRMFGNGKVLVPAIRLTEMPGIYVDDSVLSIDYHHLVFDHHQIILAEGAPSESFLLAKEAIASLDPDLRDEVLTLFPKLRAPEAKVPVAALVPDIKQQKKLIARHLKNEIPALSPEAALT